MLSNKEDMKKLLLILLSLSVINVLSEEKNSDVDGVSSASVKAMSFGYDINLKAGMYIATDTSDQMTDGINLDYSGRMKLKEKIEIPVDIEFDGYTSATQNVGSPTECITYPVSGIIKAGVGYRGPVKITGRGFFHGMYNNKELAMPWSSSTNESYLYGTVTQKARFGGDLNFNLPLEKIKLNVFSLNNVVSYDYQNTNNSTLDSTGLYDHDWWINSNVSFHPNKKIAVKANYLRKNELDNNSLYDVNMAFLGVETDLRVLKRKLYIFGDLGIRYYNSQIMEKRGYLKDDGWDKNLGIDSYIRAFLKLKKKTFIKGNILLDASTRMQKLRYELAIRKLWKKGRFSGEAGYWNSQGSRYPRMCSYVNSELGVTEKLFIIPNAKLYWHSEKNIYSEKITYSYYRTDLNLEFAIRLPSKSKKIFNKLTILGGADYKIYDDVPFFPTTINIYWGVKTYL